MFRAIILPIFRSTRLCVTACGIMHPRCCRPPATSVTGGMCETSGECSFGQTIPIQPKTSISKVQWLRRYWPEKSVDCFSVCVLYSVRDVILIVSAWRQRDGPPLLQLHSYVITDAAQRPWLRIRCSQCIVVGSQWTTMTRVRVFCTSI